MSTSQEAPALIQYACERCKTRFVLPPSSRKLNLAGKFRAFTMGVGRTFRLHEGLGAGYDASRRQLLAKMDDEAYQSFVQSFRFCHECRQFVCNECWSTSRRSCLTCVAKSMTGTVRPRPPFAPTGPEIPRPIVATAAPRKGRLRRDAALVALAIAVIMVSLEAGILLVNATSGPGASSTATPTLYAAVPTPTPTASPTDSLSASPTDSPSPSPTDTPIPTPTPTPVITPQPTPTPVGALFKPTISCSPSGTTVTCHITNSGNYAPTDVRSWYWDGTVVNVKGSKGNVQSHTFDNAAVGTSVYVKLMRTGTASVSSLNYAPFG
jgi:hypothetical protein